jgi:hypothetical protein
VPVQEQRVTQIAYHRSCRRRKQANQIKGARPMTCSAMYFLASSEFASGHGCVTRVTANVAARPLSLACRQSANVLPPNYLSVRG